MEAPESTRTFVFDVWFGPAVLKEKTAERTKIIEKENRKILRCAHPVLTILNHTVEVNYTISEFRQGNLLVEVKESHLVRFFFYQELLYFLQKGSFEVLRVCPFMDLEGQPDDRSWTISVICRAI